MKTAPPEIRQATAQDAEALAPLFEQLGYPTPAAIIEDRLRAQEDNSIVLVAERDGATLGFVGVAIQSDLIVPEHAIIHGLVVDESARGERIGAGLLRAAEHWAFERGAKTVIVRTNVIRERAHKFYEREGYQLHKTQRIFEKHAPAG